MTERRPLSAALTSIPDADPELVRSFITQGTKSEALETRELTLVPDRPADSSKSLPLDRPRSKRRARAAGVQPVGLIPVTVRLRPEIAGALKRASLERQLAGQEVYTQQDLIEQVLEPWLRTEGYLMGPG